MNYKKLCDIADIQSGLVLSRKEAKPDSKDNYKYRRLNLRSIDEDGRINYETLGEYHSREKLDGQVITREGEIVMRLFAPLRPLLITADLAGLVVPSQFAIIRVKSKNILPAYLTYYLLQQDVLNGMAAMDSGQAARGIKISTLSDVQIPMVEVNKQETIIAIEGLQQKINTLYLELLHQYSIQADVAIKRVIEGEGL